MSGRVSKFNQWLSRCSALTAVSLMPAGLAWAQAPSGEEEATPQPSETIFVTGSRIARDPNLASPIPVQSVDAEALRLSGETSLADVVNQIPALLASTTAENTTSGASALNLRGLSSVRTLTLVNGRRWVGSQEGGQQVDVNAIPRALVERVEVMTGGASAIYGSDAVTGVVNFILRDDFEGTSVDARFGISGEGDAETGSIQFVHGRNFAQGRGNVVFTADLTSSAQLLMRDRDWSRDSGIASARPNPARRFQQGEIGGSTPNFAAFYNSATESRHP